MSEGVPSRLYFRALMSTTRHSVGERLLVAAALLAMLLSRLSAFVPVMPAIEQGVLALMTGHYLSLVWRNDFAFPYLAGLYIVFASVLLGLTTLPVAMCVGVYRTTITRRLAMQRLLRDAS